MEVFPLEESAPGGILNGSNPTQLEKMKEWDANFTQFEKVLEAACQRNDDDKLPSQSYLSSFNCSSSSENFFTSPQVSNKDNNLWNYPTVSCTEQYDEKKNNVDCTKRTKFSECLLNANDLTEEKSCNKEKNNTEEMDVQEESEQNKSESSDSEEEEESEEEKQVKKEEEKKKKKKKTKKKKLPFERCNIREIIPESELDAETLAAQREEQERIRRLQEAQQRALLEAQQRVVLDPQQRLFHQQVPVRKSLEMKPLSLDNARSKAFWDKHLNWISNAKTCNSTPEINFTFNPVKKDTDIVILDSSEDEQPPEINPENNTYQVKEKEKNVIDISSSDEENKEIKHFNRGDDDDIVMLSDEEGEIEDPNNSGSHTDDCLNRPDAEGRVLVNLGHPSEDPDIYLAPQLSRIVKPHQIGGIRFLYDNVVENLKRYQTSTGFGCILAHSMGLGKTVQVISFVDIYLCHTSARSVLCIVPINTIQNWMAEFDMWLPAKSSLTEEQLKKGDIRPRNFNIYLLNENYKTTSARANLIMEWQKMGGVLLMGYEMYRMLALKKLSKKNNRRKKRQREETIVNEVEDDAQIKKLLDDIYCALVNPGPDLIICDEGHRIKNCQASTSMALKSILTKRRIVLTGYPLQNNMLEYWCMVDFVRPNYLGTRSEFCNMFERPIQNGQCIDSTPRDRQLMRFRSHVLHSLLVGFVQRRGHSVLQETLPRKEEHVLLIRMTPIQRTLYRTFVKNLIHVQNASNPLRLFAVCCKIWNHPDILYNILQDRKAELGEDNDLDIELGNLISAAASGNKINMRKKRVNKDIGNMGRSFLNGFSQETGTSIRDKYDSSISYDWAIPLMSNYIPGVLENSHKMTVLFSIIERTLRIGDKLLIFSQSLFTLDLIEKFLNQRNVPPRLGIINSSLGPVKWCRNKHYFRLDGSTSPQDREKLINEFNTNANISLFLLSTRAGCLGINLIGANRIVVIDASWNPCHDAQAVCRIYRYGQQKPCYIYRLVTDNSLEKRIYDRQVNKQGIADRVVDELNPESNFTWKEVTTLIHDNEQDNMLQDLSVYASKYNDEVLKYLCTDLNQCLSREPFEHESLLSDRKELKLTKHEKRLAKQSYEMEKRANMISNYNRPSYTSVYPGNSSGSFSFQGTNVRAPWLSQNSTILPSQSTPLPMQPVGPSGLNHIQNRPLPPHLVHSLLRQDINIPGNTAGSPSVVIKAGQEVLVMKTQKGMYLNLPDGRIVAIRLPNAVEETLSRTENLQKDLSQTTVKLFEPSADRSQQCIGIVQQSLHCGGTVRFIPPGSNAATENRFPEVIDLSDDSDQGEVVITNEVLPTEKSENTLPTTNWPESSASSSTPYNFNQQTDNQTHIPEKIDTSCGIG
ncbi:helicase ARIP4 isoform X2 [Centruroides vittatus]|uniref:helicase ARIP4 isoform X2 n=1 Tax=Centruroides vittatus TaxID=120091 RepID=UPI0035105FE3